MSKLTIDGKEYETEEFNIDPKIHKDYGIVCLVFNTADGTHVEEWGVKRFTFTVEASDE